MRATSSSCSIRLVTPSILIRQVTKRFKALKSLAHFWVDNATKVGQDSVRYFGGDNPKMWWDVAGNIGVFVAELGVDHEEFLKQAFVKLVKGFGAHSKSNVPSIF
jgi:hypothetical protein